MERLTLREAAAQLGVTPDTLRAQIHRKKLEATKVGRDWLVSTDELDRYRRQSLRSSNPRRSR